MKYKVVTHENREQWLQWRHQGIGSSDVPVIMGVSRFKKIDELLKEKSGLAAVEDQANSYIKDRGNKIETIVRDFYSKEMNIEFKPIVCEDLEKPYLIASLDGADEGMNLIIEIKLLTTQKENKINKEAEGYKKFMAAKAGRVPVDYYPQIQHQLAVTGAPVCMFIGYKEVRYEDRQPRELSKDDVAIISVLPDKEYIEKMNNKIDDFWEKVLQKRKDNENRNTRKS